MSTHTKTKSKTPPKTEYVNTLVAANSVWSDKNVDLRRRYIAAQKALGSPKAKRDAGYRAKHEKIISSVGREFFILNQGLIHSQAKIFHRNHDSDQDNVSAATLGFWEAFTKFDPDRGIAFSTFSRQYMAGALQRTVRRNEFSHLSQAEFNLRKQVRLAEAQLTASLGRSPSREEISQSSGVSLEKVLRTYSLGAASLDATIDEDGHSLGSLIESIEEVSDTVGSIDDFADDLNDLEFWVISQRYCSYGTESPSLLEVAGSIGLGREIVRRAETRAKVRLTESYLLNVHGKMPTNSDIAKHASLSDDHVNEYRRASFEDLRHRLTRLTRKTYNKLQLSILGHEFMSLSAKIIAETQCRYSNKDGSDLSEQDAAQATWDAFKRWSPGASNYSTHLKQELAGIYTFSYVKNDKTNNSPQVLWELVSKK
jgi:RNA polymerase sigma-B factor